MYFCVYLFIYWSYFGWRYECLEHCKHVFTWTGRSWLGCRSDLRNLYGFFHQAIRNSAGLCTDLMHWSQSELQFTRCPLAQNNFLSYTVITKETAVKRSVNCLHDICVCRESVESQLSLWAPPKKPEKAFWWMHPMNDKPFRTTFYEYSSIWFSFKTTLSVALKYMLYSLIVMSCDWWLEVCLTLLAVFELNKSSDSTILTSTIPAEYCKSQINRTVCWLSAAPNQTSSSLCLFLLVLFLPTSFLTDLLNK